VVGPRNRIWAEQFRDPKEAPGKLNWGQMGYVLKACQRGVCPTVMLSVSGCLWVSTWE